MTVFVGRKRELEKLNILPENGSSLVVIRGRRRIGKSRLVTEYAKNKQFIEFTGLAPTKETTSQDQLDHFAFQLTKQLHLPPLTFKGWYDAFNFMASYLDEKVPVVIFFDEISWMAHDDSTFVSQLKVLWDTVLDRKSNVVLILCSSVSTWVEENILNSTALFGRINLTLSLDEWSLQESKEYLDKVGFKGSDHDFFKLLSITGGVPWYLKQISPAMFLNENIKNLCFSRDGVLVKEFERIFNDLYKGEGATYKRIIHALGEGMKTYLDLRQLLGYEHGGSLKHYLRNLCIAGFVTEHNSWSFKTGKEGKQSLYRLSDNYLRFYVKYIEPHLNKINKAAFDPISLDKLTGWDGIIGTHVENLLLKNRSRLLKEVGVRPEEIIADNPYVQRKTKTLKGCQIDYLIQTQSNMLIICEFKFNKRSLGAEIVDEMKEKVARLSAPRGFAKVPVLVHMGDVSEFLLEQRYFHRIIDLRDWLK